MRIDIDVRVGRWQEDQGEATVEVDVLTPRPEDLPWEELCAGMVQQAIASYREKNESEGDDGD